MRGPLCVLLSQDCYFEQIDYDFHLNTTGLNSARELGPMATGLLFPEEYKQPITVEIPALSWIQMDSDDRKHLQLFAALTGMPPGWLSDLYRKI